MFWKRNMQCYPKNIIDWFRNCIISNTFFIHSAPMLADYLKQCMKTPIEENVTLKGGIGAGTFKKMGKVTEMKSCIQLCCKEMSCDVAFMSAQNCYAVECVSDDQCESTTTDTSDVQVLIAHVKKKAKKSCKYASYNHMYLFTVI